MSDAVIIVTEDRHVGVQMVEEAIAVNLGDQLYQDNRVIIAGESLAAIAGEAVGGHRVVRIGADGLAYYAEQSNEAHCLAIVGLTTGAAALGEAATIRDAGPMEESSWTWTPDAPVFLTGMGQLTQTQPVSGPMVVIGQAVSETRIVITLQPRFF